MASTEVAIADIMGRTSGGIKELGLVDADDEDDFKAKFNSLEDRWNELESKSIMISADTKELQPEFFLIGSRNASVKKYVLL